MKTITDHPNYGVSKDGKVTSFRTGRTLNTWPDKDGFLRVGLYTGCICETVLIHKLVMDEFVGPSELPIRHKNGDNSDNCLENLEYVDAWFEIRQKADELFKAIAIQSGLSVRQFGDIIT